MARNKNRKRQDGLAIAGQISAAAGANTLAVNEKPKQGQPPKKLRKLSDEQVLNRFGNAREKTKGKLSELKKLKQQVRGPQTRNLVPGPDGTMEAPNAAAKRELSKLRESLSGRRSLRQEARRREIGPYREGKKDDRKMTGTGASNPSRPAGPVSVGTAPVSATPPPATPRSGGFGSAIPRPASVGQRPPGTSPTPRPPGGFVPNSRNPNAPGYIRNPKPRRRRR